MKIKKIIFLFIGLVLLVGCTDTTNTPSKKVENFLSKYQKMDNDVLTQLDLIIDSDSTMDKDQKKEYTALMQKQYQNLSYKITDEKQEDDTATVDVEIEVYDYKSSITKSKEYYNTHKDEFVDNDTNLNNNDDNNDNDTTTDSKKYIDYKIKNLKDVEDRITYEITFNLTKDDGEWVVDDLSDTDIQKLHGLY